MNNSQKQLINILNIVLFNRGYSNEDFDGCNWNELFSEVKAHSLVGLFYLGLDKLNMKEIDIYNEVKKITLLSSFYQIQLYDGASKIFEILQKQDIKIVALKGTQIRWLFPSPEYRTMGDVDILVERTDFNKINDIMIQNGYVGETDNGIHLQYIKNKYMPIEVHWKIIDERYTMHGAIEFEQEIWENIKEERIGELWLNVLSNEDNILYLILHVAKHLITEGVGLRQLLDIVLFVDKYKDIDWDRVIKNAENMRMKKFMFTLLSACNVLFNVEVPELIHSFNKKNHDKVYDLINEIFDAGLTGRKTDTRIMANKFAKYKINKKVFAKDVWFPTISWFCENYNYVKKNKILILIAWVDHTIKTINKKINTLKEVNKNRVNSKEHDSVRIAYKNRTKLINWFDFKLK